MLDDMIGGPKPAFAYDENSLTEMLRNVADRVKNRIVSVREACVVPMTAIAGGVFRGEGGEFDETPETYIEFDETGDFITFDHPVHSEAVFTVPHKTEEGAEYKLTIYDESGGEVCRQKLKKSTDGKLYAKTCELEEGRYGAIVRRLSDE
jgi:hypothetical protein